VLTRHDPNTRRGSLLQDLIAQLFSERSRINAGRWCAYNALLGVPLLGGALAWRLSGPPHSLDARGFALVTASGVVLLAAVIVPPTWPRLVTALLTAQGVLVVLLTVGFAGACADWARSTSTHSFRYLPGLIVVGTTYGTALWADFGPVRARPRPWRLGGFIAGLALEAAVAALLVARALRDTP
jgi:hypothetical protein